MDRRLLTLALFLIGALVISQSGVLSVVAGDKQVSVSECSIFNGQLTCPGESRIEATSYERGGLFAAGATQVVDELSLDVVAYLQENDVILSDVNNDGTFDDVSEGWTGTCRVDFAGTESFNAGDVRFEASMSGVLDAGERLGCRADASTLDVTCVSGCGIVNDELNAFRQVRGGFDVTYDVAGATQPVDSGTDGTDGTGGDGDGSVSQPGFFESIGLFILDVINSITGLFR